MAADYRRGKQEVPRAFAGTLCPSIRHANALAAIRLDALRIAGPGDRERCPYGVLVGVPHALHAKPVALDMGGALRDGFPNARLIAGEVLAT